jgi:hypothetical protein
MIRSYPTLNSGLSPRTAQPPAAGSRFTLPGSSAAESESAQAAPAAKPEASLSEEESAMIQRFFPESNRMTLRLYGPHRPSELNPGAVGGRLDLKG